MAGREEQGLVCHVCTIVCPECSALFDAVTRARLSRDWLKGRRPLHLDAGWTPKSEWQRTVDAVREPVTLDQVLFEHHDPRGPWVEFPVTCPNVVHHAVQPWKDPGRCPRCGVYMERTLMPFRLWE